MPGHSNCTPGRAPEQFRVGVGFARTLTDYPLTERPIDSLDHLLIDLSHLLTAATAASIQLGQQNLGPGGVDDLAKSIQSPVTSIFPGSQREFARGGEVLL